MQGRVGLLYFAKRNGTKRNETKRNGKSVLCKMENLYFAKWEICTLRNGKICTLRNENMTKEKNESLINKQTVLFFFWRSS